MSDEPTGSSSNGKRSAILWPVISLCIVGGVVFASKRAARRNESQREQLQRAVTDTQLSVIRGALGLYRHEHGRLPPDLGEILTASERSRNYHIPQKYASDVWGNPIQYSVLSDGSAVVMSYGADGRPGGEGPARDASVPIGPATRPATQAAEPAEVEQG